MHRRRVKRIKRWFVFQLARFGAGLLSLMPVSWALALGRTIGALAFLIDARGRGVAVEQLQTHLGVSAHEARTLTRQVYANIGMVAVEIAMMPRLLRRLATYVHLPDADRELLKSAVEEGRGVIFVTGHVGNWELLAQRVVFGGFDGVTLARRAPNPYLGDWIVARRALGGLETINRGDPRGARNMLAALKRGALLGVLLDQDTKVPSVHVPFFGAPAATPTAAADLALRRGAPIVMGFISRSANRTAHEVRLFRVDPPPDGDKAERVRALTTTLTEHIEAAVRASPAEWVWFHERWRR